SLRNSYGITLSKFFVEILCGYVVEVLCLKPKRKNLLIKRREVDCAIGVSNIVVTVCKILCVSQQIITRV
ncbi:hypothetical protein, partial [Flavobacterium suncheonense]|uniref:hypothetical protein n=1 Tax=Flavobacterium suncheonense TaxID=350894 RepID=UPI001969DBFF